MPRCNGALMPNHKGSAGRSNKDESYLSFDLTDPVSELSEYEYGWLEMVLHMIVTLLHHSASQGPRLPNPASPDQSQGQSPGPVTRHHESGHQGIHVCKFAHSQILLVHMLRVP